MTEQEMKQRLIERYSDLLRLQSAQDVKKELAVQMAIVKAELSAYSVDTKPIEDALLSE